MLLNTWKQIARLSLAIVLAMPTLAHAQAKGGATKPDAQSPASIVQHFFTDAILADRANVLTARFDKLLDTTPIPGAILPKGGRVVVREVSRDTARAIVETETGPENRFADWYTFLVRDAGKWKIDNMRVYELPPAHYLILDSLETKKNLPDSVAFVRDRMRLSASSNAALKTFFTTHKAAILKLASDFESHSAVSGLDEAGEMAPAGSLTAQEKAALTREMHAIHIGAALRKHDARQCVRYQIGGVQQTTVGFMHFGATCAKPVVGAEDVMYMERVAPDWYLYRTG